MKKKNLSIYLFVLITIFFTFNCSLNDSSVNNNEIDLIIDGEDYGNGFSFN